LELWNYAAIEREKQPKLANSPENSLGVGGATLGEIAGFKALRAAWSPADRYIGPLVIVESPDKQHRTRECGLQPAETLLKNYSSVLSEFQSSKKKKRQELEVLSLPPQELGERE